MCESSSDDQTSDQGPDLSFAPLSAERWDDLATLFGARGGVGGCWCMWWRLPHAEYERSKGEANRRALRALVEAGRCPGILAYRDNDPIAWCAVAPREEYRRLETSRILRPVDDETVWSIVCLFVARAHRRSDICRHLIEAAARHATEQGAEVVEAYPVVPRKDRMPDAFAGTGIARAFERAGFREVARRSETRPIMRCRPTLDDTGSGTTAS